MTKEYIFTYLENEGDFVEIPNSYNKAFMSGFIIPVNYDNILKLNTVSVRHDYELNSVHTFDIFSLEQIKTSIPIIMPFDNSVPVGFYNFDNVFIEVNENLLEQNTAMFYSENVTVPNISHITNIPCIVLCNNKTSKITLNWNDDDINLEFQSRLNPIISFAYYYIDNISSIRYKVNPILMS